MKIYNFPNEYMQGNKRTAYLIKREKDDFKLICWYMVGKGMLKAVYAYLKDCEPFVLTYLIENENTENENLVCVKDFTIIFFNEFMDNYRKSLRVHNTKYLPYFMGIISKIPANEKCKIINFP